GFFKRDASIPAGHTTVLVHIDKLHVACATIIDPLIVTARTTIDLAGRAPGLGRLLGRHTGVHLAAHDRSSDFLIGSTIANRTTNYVDLHATRPVGAHRLTYNGR